MKIFEKQHLFLVRSKNYLNLKLDELHYMVNHLVVKNKIPDEEYLKVKISWSIVDGHTLFIYTNVELNDAVTDEFPVIVRVSTSSVRSFTLKFDPIQNIPSGNGRGHKMPISDYVKALEWIKKRIPDGFMIESINYGGFVKGRRFRGEVWTAHINTPHEIDNLNISGCSRPFGFGLLIPAIDKITFTEE